MTRASSGQRGETPAPVKGAPCGWFLWCNQPRASSVCCPGRRSAAVAEVIFMRRAAVHDSPGGSAFEQVYRSSYSTLVGQLFLLTADRAEAEDVVQEAFARLWGNWRELRGYDNHEAWVRRVAMNLAISRWRRHSRQASYQEPALPAADPGSSMADLTLALRGVSLKH